MRKILFPILIIISVLGVSCEKTFDPGTTVAKKAAGGWWVTFTQNGNDIYGLGTFFLTTYNTSASDDSLWVDDLQHSWGFKSKVQVNFKNLTFNNANAGNDYINDTVNIANGKVLPLAGKSKTGVKTDSIYLEVKFSDDASGLTYVISGTARTGFIDDDY